MRYLQEAYEIKTFLWCLLRLPFHIPHYKTNSMISIKLGIGDFEVRHPRCVGSTTKTYIDTNINNDTICNISLA